MFPILFDTKYFVLHTYWLFFGFAIIASTYTIIKLSKKNNLKIQFLSENALSLILISLLAARIVTVITNYKMYFTNFSIDTLINLIAIWDKGLNAWAGIIAFMVALYFICKKHDQDFWKWFDTIIPALVFGIAITSLGAFFDGIQYGRETSLPWGVNFESSYVKYTVPIHPTQIYSFIYSTIIGISLVTTDFFKKEGYLGLIGVITYSFLKFLEEFLRGDDTWLILGIRLAQIISLSTIIIAGIFLYLRYTKKK